jgi:hypothetical protein
MLVQNPVHTRLVQGERLWAMTTHVYPHAWGNHMRGGVTSLAIAMRLAKDLETNKAR